MIFYCLIVRLSLLCPLLTCYVPVAQCRAERSLHDAMLHGYFDREKEDQVVTVAKRVLRALMNVHKCGYLYGDLHPLNVVHHDDFWKLTDFGACVRRRASSFLLSKRSCL